MEIYHKISWLEEAMNISSLKSNHSIDVGWLQHFLTERTFCQCLEVSGKPKQETLLPSVADWTALSLCDIETCLPTDCSHFFLVLYPRFVHGRFHPSLAQEDSCIHPHKLLSSISAPSLLPLKSSLKSVKEDLYSKPACTYSLLQRWAYLKGKYKLKIRCWILPVEKGGSIPAPLFP